MINEFHNRQFDCASFVPVGPPSGQASDTYVCSAVGSVAGSPYVNGDDYINT